MFWKRNALFGLSLLPLFALSVEVKPKDVLKHFGSAVSDLVPSFLHILISSF